MTASESWRSTGRVDDNVPDPASRPSPEQPMETTMEAPRPWVARRRGLLLAIPLVFVAVCFWDELEIEALTWPLGTALVLAGYFVRVWAQRYIHWHVLGPGILATCGPYAMV